MQKILTKEGLVVYDKDIPCTVRLDKKETDELLNQEIDYSKLDNHCEIVHLEISNKCNLSCTYCYNEKATKELALGQWQQIIDSLASYGVFQITFGGGEPLLYREWPNLVQYAVNKGLNVGMTTNGLLLDISSKACLQNFKQINVSYHGEIKTLEHALRHLCNNGIKSGINFVMRKQYVSALQDVLALAKKFDSEILLLTYKPLIKDYEQVLPPKTVYGYAQLYAKLGYKVAVDGLSCYGTNQDYCLQKKTFCDIDSEGNVYPCSFIRRSIGNVLEQDFKTIWKQRGEQEQCPFLTI